MTVLCNIILFGPPFPRAIRIHCSDITNHYQLLPVPFPCSADDYRFSLSARIESRFALRSLINLEFQRYQFRWFSILRLEKLIRSGTALKSGPFFGNNQLPLIATLFINRVASCIKKERDNKIVFVGFHSPWKLLLKFCGKSIKNTTRVM